VQILEERFPTRQEITSEHSLPLLERVKVQVVVLSLGALVAPECDDVARVPLVQPSLIIGRAPALRVGNPATQQKLLSRPDKRIEVTQQRFDLSLGRDELRTISRRVRRLQLIHERQAKLPQ